MIIRKFIFIVFHKFMQSIKIYFQDRKGKNITGFVSSLNKNCTQWYSQTVMQSSKQEISDGLGKCMAEALFQYKRRQEQFPKVLIFKF